MGRGKHSADQDYSYETKFNKEFDYEMIMIQEKK